MHLSIFCPSGGGGHTRGFRQKTIPDRREFDKLMESGSRVHRLWLAKYYDGCKILISYSPIKQYMILKCYIFCIISSMHIQFCTNLHGAPTISNTHSHVFYNYAFKYHISENHQPMGNMVQDIRVNEGYRTSSF